jgi:transposase
MKAYSMDLRERIVAARVAGESVESVAQRFGVCTKTVRVYQKRAAQGELRPRPRPGRAPLLAQEQEEAFLWMVREKADWTVDQLCGEWQERSGVVLGRSTLHNHLRRLGGRYKKRAVLPPSAARSSGPPLESK